MSPKRPEEPPADYDPQQDAVDSYHEAIREIGARVRAGAPIPDLFKPKDAAE